MLNNNFVESSENYDNDGDDNGSNSWIQHKEAVGSGYNMAAKQVFNQLLAPHMPNPQDMLSQSLKRSLAMNRSESKISLVNSNGSDDENGSPIGRHNKYQSKVITFTDPIEDMVPESIVGDGVEIKGELEFERLLRIEGTFEGTLISQGDIIVGRFGTLIGDVIGVRTLYIMGGKVVGKVQVDNLICRKGTVLRGDVSCKSLSCEQYVTLEGACNVHPLAPEIVDPNGDILIDVPEIEIGLPHHDHHRHQKKEKHPSDEALLTETLARREGESDESYAARKQQLKKERKAKKLAEQIEVGLTPREGDSVHFSAKRDSNWLTSKLTDYFERHNPEKIDKIPKLLHKYYGRETELARELADKYGEEIDLDTKGVDVEAAPTEGDVVPFVSIPEQTNPYSDAAEAHEEEPHEEPHEETHEEPHEAHHKHKHKHSKRKTALTMRLTDYYNKHNPEKIDKIHKLLHKFKGREEDLSKELFEQYGDPIDLTYSEKEEDSGSSSATDEVGGAAKKIQIHDTAVNLVAGEIVTAERDIIAKD